MVWLVLNVGPRWRFDATLLGRSTREVEATAGVRWAARDALIKVESSEPLARWPEDRPLVSTRGLESLDDH